MMRVVATCVARSAVRQRTGAVAAVIRANALSSRPLPTPATTAKSTVRACTRCMHTCVPRLTSDERSAGAGSAPPAAAGAAASSPSSASSASASPAAAASSGGGARVRSAPSVAAAAASPTAPSTAASSSSLNPSLTPPLSAHDSSVSSASAPPLSVAVVGSGPAAFYTSKYLLRELPNVRIDMFERLAVPYGLVRFGVAPDHPDVKSVSHDFEVVMNDARFAFYGRVHVGRDVGLQELRQHYSAVVLAYGAAGERMLDLPGSELQGIHPARHFVNWYNAHPEHSGDTHDFKLEQVRSVAIIGQGNVAVDCARVLLSPVGRLEHTDISLDALQHLSASQVQRVHMIGRRGAVQSAFSIGELRELATGVDRGIAVRFDPKELEDSENEASLAEIQASRPKKRKHDLLRSIAAGTLPGMATTITAGSAALASDPAASASSAEATAAAGHPSSSSSVKDLHIRYLLRPKAFLPSASDPRRVGGLLLERTVLSGPPEAQEARSTGEEVRIEAELILTSIGYKSVPIDASLPFDHRKHVVPSINGRVLRSAHASGGEASAEVEPGLYVSGWLRRGPSGIIATNIMDARDTVKSLMADLRAGGVLQHPASVPTPLAILSPEQIKARRIVTREGWARIQAAELAEGLAKGKTQVKFDNEEQLLRAAETDEVPSL